MVLTAEYLKLSEALLSIGTGVITEKEGVQFPREHGVNWEFYTLNKTISIDEWCIWVNSEMRDGIWTQIFSGEVICQATL